LSHESLAYDVNSEGNSTMSHSIIPAIVSFAFLAANVVTLSAILVLNRRAGSRPHQAAPPSSEPPAEGHLDPSDILDWEFEYARTTASEAMEQRHTMVNFYLLVAGVAASGVIAVLGESSNLPKAVGTLLLWLLCGIGWLYFLAIIRLRQAWHDSARAMNQIKEFYFQHARELERDMLRSAFRWQAHTLPAPGKPWTVFFYSAMLIAFLDSAAYVAGGLLLNSGPTGSRPVPVLVPLVLFGLGFFAFHVWLYFAFLKTRAPREAIHNARNNSE
jgi:hypothetical protein